ncbi:hypothetical protein [Pelosinus sp. IPA-1]|uniref:rolling circle replication-associated protein n=1 Tax=Pelosinus sp. IPA-1 TaxID=3029569 RepID=UPI0024362353|nr:hypothetical protein [Pelosinus sp. IPA-1]GMB00409.1 hypothetical protein PIPA1_32080 [Pelosinus sp. IPA-1]
MSYREKITTAGKIKDVIKYHTSRNTSSKRPRNKNMNPTSELQKKGNERRSYESLYYDMSENFKEDDLYLTCTYGKNMEEPQPKEAKSLFKKAIDKLRYQYKKVGAVLKYIGVTEHKKGRIHHHLLINNVQLGIKAIKKVWNLGFTKIQLFGGEPEDCERLANYFIKESKNTFNTEDKVHGRRWISSNNLVHPDKTPKIRTVHASSWKEEPKPIKGYYIAEVKRGHTEHNYPYLFYRMIKIPGSDEDRI